VRIVAIAGPEETRGFRLAGFEAEGLPPEGELADRLRALASRSDVGLIVLSEEAAARAPDTVAALRRADAPFAVVLPGVS
jgi:vacuolar-type H+-ATPase subunit F/Vma7